MQAAVAPLSAKLPVRGRSGGPGSAPRFLQAGSRPANGSSPCPAPSGRRASTTVPRPRGLTTRSSPLTVPSRGHVGAQSATLGVGASSSSISSGTTLSARQRPGSPSPVARSDCTTDARSSLYIAASRMPEAFVELA